jgi:hypothetical protein
LWWTFVPTNPHGKQLNRTAERQDRSISVRSPKKITQRHASALVRAPAAHEPRGISMVLG